MSRRERDKGRKAEAEVRAIYERHGFAVRGLEGTGDHLAIGHGLTIHSEVKRQEVLRLPLWSRQALAEAPAGALPIVAYRRNREPWRALVPEEHLDAALGRAGVDQESGRRVVVIDGARWVSLPLVLLLTLFDLGAPRARPQEALP